MKGVNMYIIGINAYHGDSSTCILQNGKLIAAVEEERFKRVKHWAGFPTESIRYCLEEAGVALSDVEHVAINTDPKANFLKKVGFTLKNRPDFKLVLDRIKNKKERAGVTDELASAFPDQPFAGSVHYIEHHLSHLASTHLVSPFEDSVAVSIDGFGDFSSAAWGACYGNNINVDKRVFFPHSLGIFYQAMTQFIGFPNYGDEYKVMGLAPYGKPLYLEQMKEVVCIKSDGTFELNLNFFRHHSEKIEYEWSGGSPEVGILFNADEMEKLFGFSAREKNDALENRHRDMARSIQMMYEEAFFKLLEVIHNKYKLDQLTLAGGCAMNSVANGKVYRCSPFKKVYIQSAAGDAGGAIGAAYMVANELGEIRERFHMSHAFWGPSFSNDYYEKLLNEKMIEIKGEGCVIEKIEDDTELCQKAAQLISEGLVIGWFQGRMEWGPRALGNRSILCDPRRFDMKDILNLKIKRRESFRPFAPSILREKVSEWFEEEDDIPFMMQVFQIRKEKRDEIPAVAHVDGSGRLQTVSSDTNPKYHKLISSFEKISNVPIILNTSFNENEPVVCRPEEALKTFLRTKMDVLVLGNWFVYRQVTI
jgi:carbamoyltransferase